MKKLTLLNSLLFSSLFLVGCGPGTTGRIDDALHPERRDEQVDSGPASAEAGKVTLWTRSGGYDAAVFVPADYGQDPNKKYPLILSLHGYNGSVLNADHTAVGGKKTGFIKQVWDTPLAAAYPGIVVAPDVYPANTNENTLWDEKKLRELIIEASAKYQVDPDRVVVTGHSAGSVGAQELALRSKDLLAGIMPGAFEAVIKLNLCSVDDLPIWVFGNTSDDLFQAASWKGVEKDIADCSNFTKEFKLEVNENQCGHDCWDDHWARPEVQTWLISQKRK